MAKKNPGDILTCDWNPAIGCERCSPGCRKCWYLDGIFPWQQRLGNIPADVRPDQSYVFENRMSVAALKPKNGIVGIVQHGDLFWDGVPDEVIEKVLAIVEETARQKTARPKYILWTKRAKRMADVLTARYPGILPSYLACGVSVENQEAADARLPQLLRIPGSLLVMIEPMLGPIDLGNYLKVNWVILGSETGGHDARPLELDWARAVRDQVTQAGIPFFIKQLGIDHKRPQRELDGRTWDEFPPGFSK